MSRRGHPLHGDSAAALAAAAFGAALLLPAAAAMASEDPETPGGLDGGARAEEAVQASFFGVRGTSPALGAQVYPFAYFADAQPATALDMVRRLPGFTLDGGSTVRGLSGSGGNVLIDGQRPFTKSETIETVLQRIPAAEVERIDVSQGELAASDSQGQLVLANVIRVRTSAAGGAVSLETTVENGLVSPSLRVEANRRNGPLSIEGSGSAYFSHGRNDGGGYRLTDAAGALLLAGDTITRSVDDGVTLSAQMRRELDGGAALRVAGSHNRQSSWEPPRSSQNRWTSTGRSPRSWRTPSCAHPQGLRRIGVADSGTGRACTKMESARAVRAFDHSIGGPTRSNTTPCAPAIAPPRPDDPLPQAEWPASRSPAPRPR